LTDENVAEEPWEEFVHDEGTRWTRKTKKMTPGNDPVAPITKYEQKNLPEVDFPCWGDDERMYWTERRNR